MKLTILIDTREASLAFHGFSTERAIIGTGEYSCIYYRVDLHGVVAIERKSVSDLLGCVGLQRPRFELELSRLTAIRFRALVIEATSQRELAAGPRFSQVTSRQVLGSVSAWTLKYIVAPISPASVRCRS